MILAFIQLILKVLFLLVFLVLPYGLIGALETNGDATMPLEPGMKFIASVCTLFNLYFIVKIFIPTMF